MRQSPLLLTCTIAATVMGLNTAALTFVIRSSHAQEVTTTATTTPETSETTTKAIAIATEMMNAKPTTPANDSANGKYNVANATNGDGTAMNLSGRGALTALVNNAVVACRAEKPASQTVFETCVKTQFMQPALFEAYSSANSGLSFNVLLPNAALPFKD